MTDKYLLDGIRVVELATFVFGPAAGTILGDFGADVVHIEHPQIGDAYRHLLQLRPLPECGENYCWILTARGKKSIALDVRSKEGHEVAVELVRRADVFITNLHPSVLEKLGMRYEDVAPLNPRLIYAHATGYGDQGAEAEKPGYDATAWWARSGLMDAIRPHGADFPLATAAMGDHPSSIALFGAIALALSIASERGRAGACVRRCLRTAHGELDSAAGGVMRRFDVLGAAANAFAERARVSVRVRRWSWTVSRDGAGSRRVGPFHRCDRSRRTA